MSIRLMNEVRPLKMSPTCKAVMVWLADAANDAGVCWPSIDTICEWTCYGRTAVIEAIKALEWAGYVVVNRSNGRKTVYTVKPVRDADQSASRTGPDRGPNQSASRTKPVRQADTNHQEPSRTMREKDAGTCADASAGEPTQEISEATRTVVLTRQALRDAGRADAIDRVVAHLPDLHAALAEGITPEVIAATTAEFADRASPFAYAIRTARNRHAEGAKPAHSGDTHANHSERHSSRSGLSLAEQAARGIAERDAAEQGGQHFAGEPIDVEFCDAPGFEDGY